MSRFTATAIIAMVFIAIQIWGQRDALLGRDRRRAEANAGAPG